MLSDATNIWDGTHHWTLGRVDGGRRPTATIYDRPQGAEAQVEFLTALGLHEVGAQGTLDALKLSRTDHPLLPLSTMIDLAVKNRGPAEMMIVPVEEGRLPVAPPSGSNRLLRVRLDSPIFRDVFHVVWLDIDGDMALVRRLTHSPALPGPDVERVYEIREWAKAGEVSFPAEALVQVKTDDGKGRTKVVNEFRYHYRARPFVDADRIERPQLSPPMLVIDRVHMVAYDLLDEGVRPTLVYDEVNDREILADEAALRRATAAIPPHADFAFTFLAPVNHAVPEQPTD